MLRLSFISPLLTFFVFNLFAQAQPTTPPHPDASGCDDKGWCWGEQEGKAHEKYAQFTDNYNFGEHSWTNAVEPFLWLMDNAAFLHESIYPTGAKILDYMVDNAENADEKKKYQDKLLKSYDLRIKYFGNEANVLQRKGLKAYPYLIKRGSEYYDELFQLYQKIFELKGNDTYRANMIYYMSLSKAQRAKQNITEEEILGIHAEIADAITHNVQNADDKATEKKWRETGVMVDDMLGSIVKFDCEFIKERMGEDLRNNPDDFEMNKRAMKYMIQGECTNEPLFLEVAQRIYEQEPTGSLAMVICRRYMVEKDYDVALEWYDKAIDQYTDDGTKKGELLLEKAQVLSAQNKRQEARSTAFEAAKANEEVAPEAYALVGDLYLSSGNICQSNDPLKFRAIYLAAYDMYQRAGNAAKMRAAQEQFPSIQEIFTAGKEEGESIEVGCWIGGTTTLRRR